jgi:hypothetical protein
MPYIDRGINPVRKFFVDHSVKSEMIYNDAALRQQTIFEELAWILGSSPTSHDNVSAEMEIVGSHRSKSISLPVVKISLPNNSFMIIRGSFHNFAVSIVDSQPLNEAVLRALAAETDKCSSAYCEGFPPDMVFGPYTNNTNTFTAHIDYRADYLHVLARHMWQVNDGRPNLKPQPLPARSLSL